MTNTELEDARAGGAGALPHVHSPELRSPLQLVLDTLIDIDITYERERETLKKSSPDMISNARLLRMLKERHRERRQPLIQHLMALQSRDSVRDNAQGG
jgi:hypothetical protein